jgi:hypothetical protein
MPKIYLEYSKRLDDGNPDIQQANLTLRWLADRGWPIMVHVRDIKERGTGLHTARLVMIVKLPLGSG